MYHAMPARCGPASGLSAVSSAPQSLPLASRVVESFRQWPCGTSVDGGVPEPGCCCFGGTPYWPTVRILLLRLTAGLAVFSDAVFVSVHTMSWLEVRVPAAPETGFCASSAAFELRKYSVPLFARLNCVVPGDCAGQSVNPGCVEPASLGALTIPDVSMCCIAGLAAPAASCAFEKA